MSGEGYGGIKEEVEIVLIKANGNKIIRTNKQRGIFSKILDIMKRIN